MFSLQQISWEFVLNNHTDDCDVVRPRFWSTGIQTAETSDNNNAHVNKRITSTNDDQNPQKTHHLYLIPSSLGPFPTHL